MSVSMDDSANDLTNTRGDLATWLDDYTAGRCDRARMQASFLEICRSNPEAPWDALALLDQYQRRGRVDASLARSLKSDIAQLVFGVVNQTEEDERNEQDPDQTQPPPYTDTGSDTTGTRWRKLAAAGGSEVPRANQSFADPIQFSRDIDPMTRPPAPKPRAPQPKAGTAPGSILRDRYELLAVLGRGRNGTVYRALDRHRCNLDVQDRCVAVRVLMLNYRDSAGALAELERQFHQAQSLAHPNIVSVFDLDRDGATYFLVMELLEGELLSQMLTRLDSRPMPRAQALTIIGSIGAALAHAQRRGVVHSDLKPGNVMITADGEVKVLDFGFMRREHADPRRVEPWVSDPESAGSGATLAYASEERVNAEPADPADDVYSLGCIAYELLSGQHPFGGRSAPLARAHGRAPQRIKGLNGRQWNALHTALQWSRADRKIGVVDLIAALGCGDVTQQLIPPQGISASTPPQRWSWPAKAALVLALVGVAAAVYWQKLVPEPQSLAQQPSLGAQPAPARDATPIVVQSPAVSAPANSPEAAVIEPPPTNAASARTTAQPAEVTPPAASPGVPADSVAKADAVSPPAPKPPAGPSRVAFDKDTYVATESDGVVKLTVRRSGSTRNSANFHWTLLPNSAVAGDDFAAIGPGTEQIPAGKNSVTLTIPLVSDAVKESTELFLVEISAADEHTGLGEQSRAAVIIVDDD